MPEPTEQQVVLNGYSERGMVNAICDDILHSGPPLKALNQLLPWCRFPFQTTGSPDFSNITRATILVEQGFSDFGDLDLLILLDHADQRKQAVLLEAKVRTDTTSPKGIRSQWDAFLAYLGGEKKFRSTLFVQLYRKMRLIHQVENLAVQLQADSVASRWSLGANRVVLKAAALLAEYRSSPYYVALVPDRPTTVAHFYENTLGPFVPQASLPDWTPESIKRWGYLTWPDLDVQCQADQTTWRRTIGNFDWNKHQIYEPAEDAVPPNELPIVVGGLYRWQNSQVIVVGADAGDAKCRVVAAAAPGDYFPASFTLAKSLLQTTEEAPPVQVTELKPQVGRDYLWSPPANEAHNPKRNLTIPQPHTKVRVVRHGWETSRVRQVDGAGCAHGEGFLVFTYHIRRT